MQEDHLSALICLAGFIVCLSYEFQEGEKGDVFSVRHEWDDHTLWSFAHVFKLFEEGSFFHLADVGTIGSGTEGAAMASVRLTTSAVVLLRELLGDPVLLAVLEVVLDD